MRALLALPVLCLLAACTTAHKPAGFLTSYQGLQERDALRAKIAQRKAAPTVAVRRVRIEPTVLHPGAEAGWLNEAEQATLLREVDAQLCFELSERYEIGKADAEADARVRAAVTRVEPTGRAGSVVAAAASFFIPGPIGVRTPGALGGLSAEAEMLALDGRQLAAITWSRDATAIGTDNPSLSRLGDALQFVEPFADDAAKAMTPVDHEGRKIGKPDPCAEFGPRFRPEGWAARFATGFYFPEMSGAKKAEPPDPPEATR